MIVTGGFSGHELSSTEVIDYTSGEGGPHWGWVEVGQLPSPRDSLRGASIGGVFHVTGGHYYATGDIGEVLVFDPESKTWAVAGELTAARQRHAVTEVPLTAVAAYCSVRH